MGLNPDVTGFFNLCNTSSRTMALGSTQPLTEMSTRNLPASRLSRKCGSLDVSQPYGPVTGIDLYIHIYIMFQGPRLPESGIECWLSYL
jgi:hypothetical protein